jgi:hypothetical protein
LPRTNTVAYLAVSFIGDEKMSRNIDTKANTLAYTARVTRTECKSLVTLTPGANIIKLFTSVIDE